MNEDRPVVAVLDDEEQMRKALHRLLATHGFQVQTYATSDALMADIPLRHLDCLVLDLHMPEVNGFDVLRDFGTRQIHLPVIVITGQDSPGNAESVRSLGAAAYLLKPVDGDTLVSAIQHEIYFQS